MADQKRIWFSFLPLDYLGVERYLNDYAAQGWELAEHVDCRTLTVLLHKTKRTDLRYSVSCASFTKKGDLRKVVEQRQAAGWNPLATINHFDIYESMPCQNPVSQRENLWVPLFLRSIRTFLGILFLSAFLFLLAYVHNIPLFHAWYLSNVGLYFHLFAPVFGAVSIAYLLWLGWQCRVRTDNRLPKRAWMILRSVLPILSVAWILLLSISLMMDLVLDLRYSLLLSILLVGVSAIFYFRLRADQSGTLFSALSMILAVVIALSLVLNQVLPNESRSEWGTCSWRKSLTAVVHAEDLGLQPSSLEAVSYATQNSIFVKETKYWEGWKTLNLSSTVYQCRWGIFQQSILTDLMQENDWHKIDSTYEGCWSAEKGEMDYLLCYDGNTIVLLSANQALSPHLAAFSLPIQ